MTFIKKKTGTSGNLVECLKLDNLGEKDVLYAKTKIILLVNVLSMLFYHPNVLLWRNKRKFISLLS